MMARSARVVTPRAQNASGSTPCCSRKVTMASSSSSSGSASFGGALRYLVVTEGVGATGPIQQHINTGIR